MSSLGTGWCPIDGGLGVTDVGDGDVDSLVYRVMMLLVT